MTTQNAQHEPGSTDALGALMLGLATQIDLVATLLGGGSAAAAGAPGATQASDGLGEQFAAGMSAAEQVFAAARSFVANDPNAALIGELAGEVGTLVNELGDLLARLLGALIAILEAVAAVLRTPPSGAPAAAASANFETIAVRIARG